MGRKTGLIGNWIKREPDLPRHRGSFSSTQRFACPGQPNAPTSSTIEVFRVAWKIVFAPKVVLPSSRRYGVVPPVNAYAAHDLMPRWLHAIFAGRDRGGMPNEFVAEPVRHPSGLTCRSCRSADAPASASFDREFLQHALTKGARFRCCQSALATVFLKALRSRSTL